MPLNIRAVHVFLFERGAGGLFLATTANDKRLKGGQAGHTKRISSHLAAALVVFCLLQIVIVARTGGSLLLHLGVIVAIGIFAVAARRLERRWEMLDHSGLSSQGLALRFRRDLLQLWSVTIMGALLWLPVAIIFRSLFG